MRPSADVTRRAAIPRDPETRSRIDLEGTEADRCIYAASPTFESTYEIEWIRSDLADIEISKFVSGIVGESTASCNNPRRYYRTSTSSGYSSHSPPLSAGSYSCYASASTRDPSYGCLAVIHESETIPRPIWPSVIYHHVEDRSGNYEGICHVCGCTYNYSPSPPPPLPPTTSSSRARQVLLELSRTLNSVIDGDVTAAPEEILRDISRIVSLEIGARNDNVYEYVCPSWAFNDKNPSVWPNCVKNVASKVNPINSKLYVSPHYLGYKSTRSVPSPRNDKMTRREGDSETKRSLSLMRKKPCETKLKYSTQLECSDVGSSTEETIVSSSDRSWDRRLARGLAEDLDFTLDVTQVERLGRMIARAKRKRQWCKALTTLFGLVFFVLSVIVVSLSVTRGRNIFGSM